MHPSNYSLSFKVSLSDHCQLDVLVFEYENSQVLRTTHYPGNFNVGVHYMISILGNNFRYLIQCCKVPFMYYSQCTESQMQGKLFY